MSGADTLAPLEQHLSNVQLNAGTGTDGVTSGNVVTAISGEYIFGATNGVNSATFTAGTGYTPREILGTGMTEDLIQSVAGSIAATFTVNVTFDRNLTVIMTFKAPLVTIVPAVDSLTESSGMIGLMWI